MYLYFQNSYGKHRLIGTPETPEESFKIFSDFCKERNFKIYYIRTWGNPERKTYDVGSHTEFFVETTEELPEEELE